MITRRTIAALLLLVLVGCEATEEPLRVRLLPRPAAESPAMNLPEPLRQENWVSRAGEGSCVIASTVSLVRWQRQYELAAFLRKTYSGGQTASSIQDKLTRAGVPFVATETADPAFLEWATATRRGAIIWFFPAHCVTFAGFGSHNGRPVAWLLDNNRPEQFIPVPRSEFLKRWAGYGGFALSTLYDPAPPVPFPAITVEVDQ